MSKVFTAHAVSVVPVLLGAGHSFVQDIPKHVDLRLLEAIPAPGVTHLRYEVAR